MEIVGLRRETLKIGFLNYHTLGDKCGMNIPQIMWQLTGNHSMICYVKIRNTTNQNFKKTDIHASIFGVSFCDHYRFQEVFGAARIW